jgi:hypothetical protein
MSVAPLTREPANGQTSKTAFLLRERPGNLSGLDPGTHQHRSPADASCCYSLLLDPDATMTLACANGCSCWSADEENSPRFFLTMDALYRLS